MSVKRIFVVLLLACGAPYWLLLRARFGGQVALLLASVWGLELAALWLAASGYILDLAPIWRFWCREMLVLYLMMSWIWVGQLVCWVIYEGESMLHQQGGSRQRFAGMAWFASKPSPFLDLFLTYLGLMLLAMPMQSMPPALRDTTSLVFLASAGCFLLLALMCHGNGNMMPLHMQPRQPRPKKAKRYLTTTWSRAKRSREGLEHIFSRRDPALKRVTTQ
jgi:hypothetical protein